MSQNQNVGNNIAFGLWNTLCVVYITTRTMCEKK